MWIEPVTNRNGPDVIFRRIDIQRIANNAQFLIDIAMDLGLIEKGTTVKNDWQNESHIYNSDWQDILDKIKKVTGKNPTNEFEYKNINYIEKILLDKKIELEEKGNALIYANEKFAGEV